MTLFGEKLVKLQQDQEIEKKGGGIQEFKQNMCRKAGFENPIMYMLFLQWMLILTIIKFTILHTSRHSCLFLVMEEN